MDNKTRAKCMLVCSILFSFIYATFVAFGMRVLFLFTEAPFSYSNLIQAFVMVNLPSLVLFVVISFRYYASEYWKEYRESGEA